MNFGEKQKKRISINITSLVDILIVLLLFFMLTTQFVHMEILNLSLSGDKKNGGGNVTGRNPAIIVTLTGSGNFMLNNNEFNLLQLKEKIKPLLEKGKDNDIMLISRKEAPVQDVVTAIDYIKIAGGRNISIAEDFDNNVRK